MPGDKCRLGAGCVNSARPVLRGFKAQFSTLHELGHPAGNRWDTEKRSCTLNLRGFVSTRPEPDLRAFSSGYFYTSGPVTLHVTPRTI
ncbi:hypothetical protein Poly59_31430 [Rubripirellula reticaptiva]|uniref:Uncharacterized protein n=1 Tax=Rubripirellula reticaptiva TaxID=2528013 RepID=A0A5C6ETA4_9BACT|nr:hypothetical protein Poly59_31430 [Rubripirellula reticaptiva]